MFDIYVLLWMIKFIEQFINHSCWLLSTVPEYVSYIVSIFNSWLLEISDTYTIFSSHLCLIYISLWLAKFIEQAMTSSEHHSFLGLSWALVLAIFFACTEIVLWNIWFVQIPPYIRHYLNWVYCLEKFNWIHYGIFGS